MRAQCVLTRNINRVFPHAQSELLKSGVKVLASLKAGLSSGGLSFAPSDAQTTGAEDFDKAKRNKNRERERRQRDRRARERKGKKEKARKSTNAVVRLKVGSEDEKGKSNPKLTDDFKQE